MADRRVDYAADLSYSLKQLSAEESANKRRGHLLRDPVYR